MVLIDGEYLINFSSGQCMHARLLERGWTDWKYFISANPTTISNAVPQLCIRTKLQKAYAAAAPSMQPNPPHTPCHCFNQPSHTHHRSGDPPSHPTGRIHQGCLSSSASFSGPIPSHQAPRRSASLTTTTGGLWLLR